MIAIFFHSAALVNYVDLFRYVIRWFAYLFAQILITLQHCA